MKIAVSSMGNTKESISDMRFGRCEYFAVYNDETKEYEFFENSGITSNHGAGISASSQLAEVGVDAVITGRVGPNAIKVLEEADVKIYRHLSLSIEDEIDAYKEHELEEITTPGVGHFGMANRRGQR